MRWGREVRALILVGLCAAPAPAPAQPRRVGPPRIVVPQRRLRDPFIRRFPGFGFRRIVPVRPPPFLLPPPPPDENLAPPGVGASPLIEDQRAGPTSLPHGFQLTEEIGRGGRRPAGPATLNRFSEIGQALAACFTPLASSSWASATLRVSFRRDGSVFGQPLLPYIDAGSAQQKSDLARSLLAALKTCAPLHLSPSLGAAVAGEIFAIRFLHIRTYDDRH